MKGEQASASEAGLGNLYFYDARPTLCLFCAWWSLIIGFDIRSCYHCARFGSLCNSLPLRLSNSGPTRNYLLLAEQFELFVPLLYARVWVLIEVFVGS